MLLQFLKYFFYLFMLYHGSAILLLFIVFVFLGVSFAGKYCGYSKPKPIVSLGSSLMVHFNTNDRNTDKGFKAVYRAVDPNTVNGN